MHCVVLPFALYLRGFILLLLCTEFTFYKKGQWKLETTKQNVSFRCCFVTGFQIIMLNPFFHASCCPCLSSLSRGVG
jgi:hypothetical protein